ncbi:MAG TPA: hypothetical protein PLP27_09385 [Crocinitomicaceae bacterium]|nr:hypothetical protein [Crocinitomicaceae bacterium]
MIRTRLVLLTTACGLLMWRCNTNSAEHHHDNATTHEVHHHHEGALEIELDNGKKWKVNEEMTPFILGGKELVDTYVANKGTDYKKLANDLQAQNKQLISSCTMDGKSHDELHKWLHPHLDYVKNLSNATDSDEANHIIEHLQHSYEEYKLYFE